MAEAGDFSSPDFRGDSCEHFSEDVLLGIDWEMQAEGYALWYEQTGDPDYELMRVEAVANARRKQEILSRPFN